MKIKIVDPEP